MWFSLLFLAGLSLGVDSDLPDGIELVEMGEIYQQLSSTSDNDTLLLSLRSFYPDDCQLFLNELAHELVSYRHARSRAAFTALPESASNEQVDALFNTIQKDR